MSVSTYAMKVGSLAADTAVGGKLKGAKVILIKAPVVLSEGMGLANLTVADFAGYAPVAVVAWTAPYVDGVGEVRVDGGDVLFQPTDSVLPNTIYAWGLVDTLGTGLLYVEPLPTPSVLSDPLHGLNVDVSLKYGF